MTKCLAMGQWELATGSTVARYIIERKIGQGGMGAVYLARSPSLEHGRVAIKVLAAQLAEDAAWVARFQAEAQAASRIGHPNIISVLDCGMLDDGRPFLVMEFLEGEPLDERLRKAGGRLAVDEARAIFDQLCLGLSAAHQAGIVHRDLKPENTFLVRPRHGDASELYVKILDFGIAKTLDAAGLTITGQTMGTPHYMSPEQCRGQQVDARADIYSLGVILYECFTGQRPFAATSVADLMVQQIMDQPVAPSQRNPVSPALERLILDCLRKSASDRPGSVNEVRTRLRLALDETTAAPAPPLGHGAALAAAAQPSPVSLALGATHAAMPTVSGIPPVAPQVLSGAVAARARWLRPGILLMGGLALLVAVGLGQKFLAGPARQPPESQPVARPQEQAPQLAPAAAAQVPPPIVPPIVAPRPAEAPVGAARDRGSVPRTGPARPAARAAGAKSKSSSQINAVEPGLPQPKPSAPAAPPAVDPNSLGLIEKVEWDRSNPR